MMGLDTIAPQPTPKEGQDSVTDSLIQDLLRRREGGMSKYGTELQTHNGRDALVDMFQEMLDATLYLKQCLLEEEDRKAKTAEMAESLKAAKGLLQLLAREVPRKLWVIHDIVKYLDTVLYLLNSEDTP